MKKLNQKGRLHSVFLLDEAPTLFIPNYDKVGPSTARSNKVCHMFIVQSIAQIKERYGAEMADVVTASMANWMIMQLSLIQEANTVTRMIGRAESEKKSISTGKGENSKSKTTSVERLNLIEDEEIMVLEKGRIVGKLAETNGKFPAIFNVKPDIFKLQSEHSFNDFVYRKTSDGNERLDKKTVYDKVAKKMHGAVTWQAEQIIRIGAIKAVAKGLSEEVNVFPEHFTREGKRLFTLFGDPIQGDQIKDKRNPNGPPIGTVGGGYFSKNAPKV
jgi:hypothetical protein